MRIGLDARMYRSSTGGIGTYSQQLIKYLAKLDQKNQYFLFLTKKDLKEYNIKAKNFQPIPVDIPHYSLGEQLRLPGILRKYQLDLVHFLHFTHPIFYPAPFIISIHDLTMSKSPVGAQQKSPLRAWSYRLVMKNAISKSLSISTLSQATKKDILNSYSVEPEKIKVIYLATGSRFQPLSTKESRPILKKYQLKKPYLLFVGQWRPHKGISYLLQAIRLFRERFQNQEITLAITGKPTKKFPQTSQAIAKAKQEGLVQLPGFVKDQDLPAIYCQAEAFIFPSLYEGFGLPPLEAMACGIPVASSNLSSLPEVLGKAPLYFDPRDPADIALKINTLLTNHKLADKLVKRGLKQVQKYSWQKTAQETLKLYQKALKK